MKSIRKDFIPHVMSKLRAWLLLGKKNISTIAGAVGYTPTQTTAYENKAQEGMDAIDAVDTTKANYKSAVKNLHEWMSPKGKGLNVLRGYANTIKSNPGCTNAVGALMQYWGSHELIDFVNYKPSGTAKAHNGYILIKYDKMGVDLMSVYYRVKGSNTWIHIGNLSETSYHHHYVLPVVDPPVTPAIMAVVLEYKLVGVHHDIEIGQPSDTFLETYVF